MLPTEAECTSFACGDDLRRSREALCMSAAAALANRRMSPRPDRAATVQPFSTPASAPASRWLATDAGKCMVVSRRLVCQQCFHDVFHMRKGCVSSSG